MQILWLCTGRARDGRRRIVLGRAAADDQHAVSQSSQGPHLWRSFGVKAVPCSGGACERRGGEGALV